MCGSPPARPGKRPPAIPSPRRGSSAPGRVPPRVSGCGAGCAAPGVPELCGGAPAAPIPHKDAGPGWAAGRLLSECKPGSIHLLTLFRNHFP